RQHTLYDKSNTNNRAFNKYFTVVSNFQVFNFYKITFMATETVHKQTLLSTGAPGGAKPPVDDHHNDITTSASSLFNLVMDAIPYLPLFSAIFCCFMNIVLPGSGTALSGVFLQSNGQCRIKSGENPKHTALVVNLIVALCQFGAAVILNIIGWIWSIVWGVFLIQYAEILFFEPFFFTVRRRTVPYGTTFSCYTSLHGAVRCRTAPDEWMLYFMPYGGK
uniref:Uncharacterized protein n=1 Tax=Romanomermis culicivorax TaxID=13658 RepID=A0A915HUE1_ROMCU